MTKEGIDKIGQGLEKVALNQELASQDKKNGTANRAKLFNSFEHPLRYKSKWIACY